MFVAASKQGRESYKGIDVPEFPDKQDQHDNELFGIKRNQKMTTVVPAELIVSKIVVLRGENVLLDRDLAELYGVETGALNRAVKRNAERFPKDFMFQITGEEVELLRCQADISKPV